MMKNGPSNIEDLRPEPENNSPYGSDDYSAKIVAAYIKELSSYIAQLHQRVSELERKAGGEQ
jgi:hypothetical protein